MSIKAFFVDSDIRYDQPQLAQDNSLGENIDMRILKGDKRFVQVAVIGNGKDYIISPSCNGSCKIIPHVALSTMAFIGHAGWYARNRKGILPTGPKVAVKDILSNNTTFDVLEGTVQSIWLELVTWQDSIDSSCTIDISNSSDKATITLNLRLLNMAMPAACDYHFKVEYWQYPYSVADYYGVEPFSSQHIDILRTQMSFYRDLGGYGAVASIVEEAWGGQTYSTQPVKYPSMVRWLQGKDGKMQYDFTHFDAWVKLLQEIGLDKKIICYSMMSWGNYITYCTVKGKVKRLKVTPITTGKYRKYWLPFLQSFTAHLDELGIFDKVYMGFDERSNMNSVLDILHGVTNKDGHHYKVSASFNSFISNKKCFDRLDYASVGLDEAIDNLNTFRKECQLRSASHQDTSIYTATDNFPNSFALSMPCESYWTVMFSYANGANNFLRWAYDAWVQDPLRDATHCSFPAGDCFLIYPQERDSQNKSPLWSTRLVRLDDGVRDINILNAICAIAPQHIVDIINALLLTIRHDYQYDVVQDNSWGVSIMKAKWADSTTQQAMPKDMRALKQSIYDIIEEYLNTTCIVQS